MHYKDNSTVMRGSSWYITYCYIIAFISNALRHRLEYRLAV